MWFLTFTKNHENTYFMTNENIPNSFTIMFNFKYMILLHESCALLSIKCILNMTVLLTVTKLDNRVTLLTPF